MHSYMPLPPSPYRRQQERFSSSAPQPYTHPYILCQNATGPMHHMWFFGFYQSYGGNDGPFPGDRFGKTPYTPPAGCLSMSPWRHRPLSFHSHKKTESSFSSAGLPCHPSDMHWHWQGRFHSSPWNYNQWSSHIGFSLCFPPLLSAYPYPGIDKMWAAIWSCHTSGGYVLPQRCIHSSTVPDPQVLSLDRFLWWSTAVLHRRLYTC